MGSDKPSPASAPPVSGSDAPSPGAHEGGGYPGAPVIRRAVPAEADEVAGVWLRSFDAALPTLRRPHTDDEVRAYFRAVVVPREETWIADAAGRVVGVLVLGDAEIDQLYLEPQWRGRGLGDRLVTLAKARYPAGLTLWTFQVNAPARRFYERHGFAAVEFTDGQRNEEKAPDVRYRWRP